MVVHWDGKILPDLVGKDKVDRIAVLVSFDGTSKFLGAPKIETSTGENIAAVVHKTLTAWNIADHVTAMSFDTTSSNTGIHIGACTFMERHLERALLPLACRHHIYELDLKAVFELKCYASSAPGVPIFERFAKNWTSIDQNSFKSGIADDVVSSQMSDIEKTNFQRYCHDQLKRNQSREDYKEFLHLSLIFIGETGYRFRAPGATSNARWMSKAIYSLKMFIFRDQFKLTSRELKGLRDICLFLIRLYIKVWFGCTNAIAAPFQDLSYIKSSIEYAKSDSTVSKAILDKKSNHLWYLCEELVALAFFDSNVSFEVKRKMVQQLKSREPRVKLSNNRNHKNLNDFASRDLDDFVSEKTKNFFSRFRLSSTFLKFDPSTWETKYDFEEGWSFCKDLFVVNDTAERGVKFIKDYNRILTNDEEQKQLLLQVVESYRKKYRSHKKSDLV